MYIPFRGLRPELPVTHGRSPCLARLDATHVWTLFAVLLLLMAAKAEAGEVQLVDGVPHIRNGAQPSQGHETVRLEELWRVGGEGDDVFFGLITQVCHDEAGNIYLLDSQLCEVQVYSADGRHLKTLFRRGEGPGEVLRPRNLAMLGDGTVGVIREFPGAMIRVDRDNNPAPNVIVHKPAQEGFIVLDGCFAGGPTLLLSGTHAHRAEETKQNRITFLGIFSLEGDELVRLAERTHCRDYTNFVLSERKELPGFFFSNCVGPDGRVYTAPDRDRYAIEVYSPAGELETVIEREYEHYRRTDEERQRLYDAFDIVMRGADIEYAIDIEENEYDILSLQHGVRLREDGTLWILPSRGVHDQPPGVMMTFDVFDADGHFINQVSIRCDADGVYDGLFFVGSDRALVVTGHVEAILAQYGAGASSYETEDGGAVMEVICYRIAG